MSRLQERSALPLTEIIENERSRLVIIVTFLAVLELWKWQRINVRQSELLGPIMLERGDRWSDDGQETMDSIED